MGNYHSDTKITNYSNLNGTNDSVKTNVEDMEVDKTKTDTISTEESSISSKINLENPTKGRKRKGSDFKHGSCISELPAKDERVSESGDGLCKPSTTLSVLTGSSEISDTHIKDNAEFDAGTSKGSISGSPDYLKPFQYGWKREQVFRATLGKRNCDIYYHTPTGRKVRSIRELSEHLENKDLTLENFTFAKQPLGLNDPEKEIIRYAGIKLGSGTSLVKKPKVKIRKATTTKKIKTKVVPNEVKVPNMNMGSCEIILITAKEAEERNAQMIVPIKKRKYKFESKLT